MKALTSQMIKTKTIKKRKTMITKKNKSMLMKLMTMLMNSKSNRLTEEAKISNKLLSIRGSSSNRFNSNNSSFNNKGSSNKCKAKW